MTMKIFVHSVSSMILTRSGGKQKATVPHPTPRIAVVRCFAGWTRSTTGLTGKWTNTFTVKDQSKPQPKDLHPFHVLGKTVDVKQKPHLEIDNAPMGAYATNAASSISGVDIQDATTPSTITEEMQKR